ncbi:autotransporter outer membrane beta-barrel domain-containing protein [Taklimakanibacter lacteus]|uniref:autotransporter outer membrane beta-barrel domain-containing protein n=1 Tax=Taklimakanibacter lacteus TaxID=2268456 RepID=UPI000E674DBB
MVRIDRRWGYFSSTALFALAIASGFGLTTESAEAACTTNLAVFPAQPLPSGQSYVTLSSTGVVVPDGTVIHSNHTDASTGGDGIHIVPAPGGAGPYAANNGNGCIETVGTVSITVDGLNDDRDGIRVIAAEPGADPALAGSAEVYASAGTTIVTNNLMGDGIIARSSIGGDFLANGSGNGNTIVHSQATITTHGIASAGITTRNAGLLSEIISGGNITTDATGELALGFGVPVGTYSVGISLTNLSGDVNAVARLTVNNNSTVQTQGTLSPAASVSAFGAARIEVDSSLASLITTGDDSPGLVANSTLGNVTATAGRVSATGQFSSGVVAIASGANAGSVDLVIAQGAIITGGWQVAATGVSAKTGVAAAGVIIGGGVLAPSSLTNNGAIGALSDRAIAAAERFTRVPNPVQPFPGTTYSEAGGGLSIENNNLVTGFVELGTGEVAFTNTATFDTRHFADTDGDGVRDTERVAISDFGGNAATSFGNDGILRLLTVTDPGSIDSTDQYTPTGVSAGAYDIGLSGVEQAQLLNLPLFINSGVITLQDGETGGTGPVAGDVLVISGGDDAGSDGGGVFRTGGALRLDTVLNEGGAANSISDVLVVDSTELGAGPTLLSIANAGGAGGSTDLNNNGVADEGEGILVVEVLNSGASVDDAFALAGPVRAGAWTYDLFWGATGGDWYLVNFFTPTLWHPMLPSPLGMPRAQASHCDSGGGFPNDRNDTEAYRNGCGCPSDAERRGEPCRDNFMWTRVEGGHARRAADDGDDGYKLNHWLIQAGYEGMGFEDGDSRLSFGPFAHIQSGDLTSIDALRHADGAKVDFFGYGGGLAADWDDEDGYYVDAMLQVTLYDLDVEDADGADEGAEGDTDGWSYGASIEAGKSLRTSERFQITPHAGLIWNVVDIDDYRGSDGADREFDPVESTLGYAGLRGDYTSPIADSYFDAWLLSGTVKIEHEFDGDSTVASVDPVSGASASGELDGEDTRLGFIGRVSILQSDAGSAHSLGLLGGYTTSLERDSDAYKGSLEFKVSW